MARINEFQIIDHGIDGAQYFPGCGVSFTEFEECYTGVGASAAEALDDALDMAAGDGWDVEEIDNDLSTQWIDEELSAADMYHYVSIRIR